MGWGERWSVLLLLCAVCLQRAQEATFKSCKQVEARKAHPVGCGRAPQHLPCKQGWSQHFSFGFMSTVPCIRQGSAERLRSSITRRTVHSPRMRCSPKQRVVLRVVE